MDEFTRLTLAAALIAIPVLAGAGWYAGTYKKRQREKERRRGIKRHGH
jgi:lipopolysaccharide biosynthesis regulator YciM